MEKVLLNRTKSIKKIIVLLIDSILQFTIILTHLNKKGERKMSNSTSKVDAKRNFYSLEELRTIIFDQKISKAAIYMAAKKGDIPTINVGRRILVPAEYVTRITSI